MKFNCQVHDFGYDDWREVEAIDPEDAAKTFADQMYCELSYPERFDVLVMSPRNELSRWSIWAEQTVRFSAREYASPVAREGKL